MKMTIFLAIVGMMLPMVSHAHSVEDVDQQKIYIEPAQLSFVDHQMFACVAGEWVSVDSIHSDAQGLYVKPLVHNYPYTRWICTCYYNNDGADTTCQRVIDENTGKKCGRPRPQ